MAVGYTAARRSVLTNNLPLRFRESGEFRILHLTDIHKVCPEMDDEADRTIPERNSRNTLYTMRQAIARTNPDLVVFGGDNIAGHWDEMTDEYALRCMEMILKPIREKHLPLAIVFGNHDAQNNHISRLLNREIQMSLYMDYDNFRGCFNEADVYGCGNYHLPVLSATGEDVLWNVWCMDSNDYPRRADYSVIHYGQDEVHDDQIAWYEQTVQAEKEKFGRTVPAVLFQHIPVQQAWDCMEECPEEQAAFTSNGKFYRAKAGALLEGEVRETPCTAYTRKQLESWVKCGDVKGAFFGHDHTNTFVYEKDGIRLYQTPCCGYETAGDWHRGGRLIVLHPEGTFHTELVLVEEPDSES